MQTHEIKAADMTNIHYITAESKQAVFELLRDNYANQEVSFISALPKLREDWKRVEYLLLLEPVKVGREYYALSKIWKNWLYRNAPQVKLLIATYGAVAHPNTLNLLDLPENIVKYCRELLEVQKYIPRRKSSARGAKEAFTEPWNNNLPLSGMDAKKEVERFLNGHDRNSSFYSQMVQLRNQLQNLSHFSNKAEARTSEDDKKIRQYREHVRTSQAHLQNRWHQYQHLIEYLPFREEATQLDKSMTTLKNFMKSAAWRKQEISPDVALIESIRDTVKNNFAPYVFTGDQ